MANVIGFTNRILKFNVLNDEKMPDF